MKRMLSMLGAVLVIVAVAVNVVPAFAAPSASSGLSINPRKNLVVDSGQTIKGNLVVGNLSSTATLAISLRVVDFTFYNNSGTPKLFLAPNAPQTTWSIKSFMHLPSSEVIGPDQTVQVPYSVTIPKDQGAGSYYGAVVYSAASGSGGNADLDASGVSLVFINVPGTVHENLTLQKFGAYTSDDNDTTGGFESIATSVPKMLAYTLKNSGNVGEAPSGSIVLKNMSGKTISTIKNANQDNDIALIGQTRLFSTCIESEQNTCVTPHLTPGMYTANLELFYGQNGNPTKEITGAASFWYLPGWFIGVVLVVLLVIILLILFAIFVLPRLIRTYGVWRLVIAGVIVLVIAVGVFGAYYWYTISDVSSESISSLDSMPCSKFNSLSQGDQQTVAIRLFDASGLHAKSNENGGDINNEMGAGSQLLNIQSYCGAIANGKVGHAAD